MCLEKFCRVVQIEVRELGAYIWEEDSPPVGKNLCYKTSEVSETSEVLIAKCERLAALVKRRSHLAGRFHTALVELQRRLTRHETMAADLLKRAKIFHRLGDRANAWDQSLQLEQLRQLVHHERSRLKTLENIHGRQLAQLTYLRQRLGDLQERLAL